MLDTSVPSQARAWDYLLGGGASFAADRALAARLLGLHPGLREVLVAARAQAAAAVARVARQGVDQYLDVAAGLPTSPATHQAAGAARPGARVCYVDRDPAVVAHGAALVPPGARYAAGDLAEPEALLAAPEIRGHIDFSRPVCLVLSLVVQAVEPGTAQAVVAVLVRAMPPGSYLIMTAGLGERGRLPDCVWPGGPSAADLESFFAGLDLIPPGIAEQDGVLCATGVKTAPRPAVPPASRSAPGRTPG